MRNALTEQFPTQCWLQSRSVDDLHFNNMVVTVFVCGLFHITNLIADLFVPIVIFYGQNLLGEASQSDRYVDELLTTLYRFGGLYVFIR